MHIRILYKHVHQRVFVRINQCTLHQNLRVFDLQRYMLTSVYMYARMFMVVCICPCLRIWTCVFDVYICTHVFVHVYYARPCRHCALRRSLTLDYTVTSSSKHLVLSGADIDGSLILSFYGMQCVLTVVNSWYVGAMSPFIRKNDLTKDLVPDPLVRGVATGSRFLWCRLEQMPQLLQLLLQMEPQVQVLWQTWQAAWEAWAAWSQWTMAVKIRKLVEEWTRGSWISCKMLPALPTVACHFGTMDLDSLSPDVQLFLLVA